jgi:hypothetical protein
MAAYTAALSDNLDQLQLETGDDSMEVQVPDFHFDWGVDKEPQSQPPRPPSGLRALTLGRKRSQQTPSPQATVSAHSSASSGHVMGLTDASTVSGSSLVPTPPQGAGMSLGSGFSPTGRPASASARRFQRVVSAPIARQAQTQLQEEDEGVSKGKARTGADAALGDGDHATPTKSYVVGDGCEHDAYGVAIGVGLRDARDGGPLDGWIDNEKSGGAVEIWGTGKTGRGAAGRGRDANA